MKKVFATALFLFLFLLSSLGLANDVSVERDSMEHYELQEVGTIMMHGGENSGAYYQIISDNGVASLYYGNEVKGCLTFLKAGDAIVDMYMPFNGKLHVSRYHYHIVPKGTFDPECINIFNYVNSVRNRDGLRLLEFSAELNAACAVRAKELATNYSHTRPNGTSFLTAIPNKEKSVVENICVTVKPSSDNELPEYFNAWDFWNKNSESRKNMLNPAVSEMGLQYYFDPVTQKRYWVQILSGDFSVYTTNNNGPSASDSVSHSDNIKPVMKRDVERFPEEVLRLVNEERVKVGARPLKLSQDLLDAAAIRAIEISQSYSHTRPNGENFYTLLRKLNHTVGENISGGRTTPEEAVEAWMNSPGHRANILNKEFKELGVGYCHERYSLYKHYWVQIFRG